jgi:hypothetical protein
MSVYTANIEAMVSATLRVIADTVDEASEKAERMIRNDIPHSVQVTQVNIAEENP